MKNSVRALTLGAMLTAMSVIRGIFCKNFLDFGAGLFRITFENLPIILAGIILGPVVGGAVGAASDLVSYLLSAQIFAPNFIVTLGAASVGVISGVIARYVVKKNGYAQIITAGALAHAVGSMIIKPIGLFGYFGWLVLWRVPLYLIRAPLEITLLCFLYKNASFRKLISFDGKRRKG